MAGLAESYIRKAKFVVDPDEYTILHLRDDAKPDLTDALVWLHAHQDHTLVIPRAAARRWDDDASVTGRDDGWKLITIEVDVPLTVHGFFRPFVDALAADEVPVVPFAGYRFDHILIHATNLDRALACLKRVQAKVKTKTAKGR
jgi:hypothetical protein